jgi:hypothetical protein
MCGGATLNDVKYAYLLGMYLGDGHIAPAGRTLALRIACANAYPLIMRECKEAIVAVRSGPVGCVAKIGCVDLQAYWNHWPCVFPQHGPGRKHERPIRLEDWQQVIADRYPDRFLRGLIHSDGCRHLNRVKGKGYPRYQFTNASMDILELFCRACDAFGVRWRRMNERNISVARRADVAKLDRAIGRSGRRRSLS